MNEFEDLRFADSKRYTLAEVASEVGCLEGSPEKYIMEWEIYNSGESMIYGDEINLLIESIKEARE